MNKRIVKYIFIATMIIIIVIVLDYFNVLYFISKNLNFDFLNIFANSLIIVLMFCITYVLIEKRNLEIEIEKKKNKTNALYYMLMRSYINCQSTFEIINDPNILKNHIVPKCNFNATKDEFIEIQKNSPFEFNSQIIDMMLDGDVEKNLIMEYFSIKSMYNKYLNMKIVFFDIDDYKDEKSRELKKIIEKDKNELSSKLNNAMKKIDKLI